MTTTAFVLSDILDLPTQLHVDRPTSFGREPGNDVVLTSAVVSRHHAVIRSDGRGFVLFDLGSTNGTSVNGRNVSIARLVPGDVVGVGPFDFRFVTAIPEHAQSATQETSVLASPGSFTGEIGAVALGEVWQLLELNQKTGLLEVRDGERRGTVWFAQGAPIHAQCGELLGNPAALKLLALAHGMFRFTGRETVRIPRTIQGVAGGLLMEAARLVDEQRRRDSKGAKSCSR